MANLFHSFSTLSPPLFHSFSAPFPAFWGRQVMLKFCKPAIVTYYYALLYTSRLV